MISSNRGGRLAPLLIGVAMRQASSPTAQLHAILTYRGRRGGAHECCATAHHPIVRQAEVVEITA